MEATPSATTLYSQQSTVRLSAFGADLGTDFDVLDGVEEGMGAEEGEVEDCDTPTANPLLAKGVSHSVKEGTPRSNDSNELSAPKAFTTKYRPSVNRASLTLLKKAKTDLGGFLRYRGGAKVAAADDTASVGSVAESQTESYSGGSSNPYKNRVSREGSAGSSVFDLLKVQETPQWKQKLQAWCDGLPGTLLVTIFTLIALFMDDFRLAVLPPALDPGCEVLAGAILIIFTLDLASGSFTRDGYFLRTYFWIDVVATVSMLLDMPHFVSQITGDQIDDVSVPALDRVTPNSAVARVRSITRVTRILRLLRVARLYQQYQAAKENQAFERANNLSHSSSFGIVKPKHRVPWWADAPSRGRVGQKLLDLTSQRVIISILTLLLIIPGFNINSGLYGEYPDLANGGLQMLHDSCSNITLDEAPLPPIVNEYLDTTHYSLLGAQTRRIVNLTLCNSTWAGNSGNGIGLRVVELGIFHIGCEKDAVDCEESWAIFDQKWYSQFGAALNLLRTAFIVLAMGWGIRIFNHDSTRLVLRPIERMLKKVRDVSENPLANKHSKFERGVKEADKLIETRLLENAINKICSLLAVGFGDAGAEVIADNMKSGGDLNPMVPGQRVVAIFGFCDIRQFTDTTEVLQEEIMEFVNSIARIVHMEVSLHGGSPNKNIGDAFLLVWKFPKAFSFRDIKPHLEEAEREHRTLARMPSMSYPPMNHPSVVAPGEELDSLLMLQRARELADKALAAFIIIHAALKRSQRLFDYSLREDLNKRMPNFQVRMGFGLHVGWAIEGAIGSEYKIDASYLSPNVNMASRLEAATKQFGTSLLLSEDFVRILSPPVRRRVRQIDCVTVKGSMRPMGLYTYDVVLDRVPRPEGQSPVAPLSPNADSGPSDVNSYSFVAYEDEYASHPDIVSTWGVDEEFLARFGEGFLAYRTGDWATAKTILEETLIARRGVENETVLDGPSSTLLNFMGTTNYVPPAGWRGCRELTEK